jgi:hypothetical protein
MLVLVVDFVYLIFEEFVVVSLLIIDDADDQQKTLNNYTLNGAEKCGGVVSILQ